MGALFLIVSLIGAGTGIGIKVYIKNVQHVLSFLIQKKTSIPFHLSLLEKYAF